MTTHCRFSCRTTLLAGCSLQLHSPDLSWEAMIDWSCDHQYGNSLNACEQALLKVSDKYGQSQHVHSPTVAQPSSGRLLDLVYASHPTVIQAAMSCLVLVACDQVQLYHRSYVFLCLLLSALATISFRPSREKGLPTKRL